MTQYHVSRIFTVRNFALNKTCGHTHRFPALIKCLCRHNRINSGWEITYDEKFWNGRTYAYIKKDVIYNNFPDEIKTIIEKHYANYRMAHTLNLPETIATSLLPVRNSFSHTICAKNDNKQEKKDIACCFCHDSKVDIFVFSKPVELNSCKKCTIEFREYLNSLDLFPQLLKTKKAKK